MKTNQFIKLERLAFENNLELNTVLKLIKNTIEAYFNKEVTWDEDFKLVFIDTNKKITISKDLEKIIKIDLHEQKEYIRIKDINSKNKTLIKATIIKTAKNGYYLKSKDNDDCFFSTQERNFELHETHIFYVNKIRKGVLYLVVNNQVIEYKLRNILKNESIFVERYVKNKLLVFSYKAEKKLNKEQINILKIFFKNEKFIYKKKED